MTRLDIIPPAHAASGRLLDAASLKEAFVGGVLPDVGGVALLGGVDLRVRRCRVLRDLGIVAGAFRASIGGRDRRHMIMAGHLGSLSWLFRWNVGDGQRAVGNIGSVADAAMRPT